LIFYAETSAYFSSFFLSLFGVKVIWVIHFQESVWFNRNLKGPFVRLKRWNMNFVDHFIVQSSAQLTTFNVEFPGRVSFIPHGWWCGDGPVQRANPKPSITVVGTTFRDFEFLKVVMERFYELFPEVTFDLVGIDAAKLGADNGPYNMRVHGRLATEAYRKVLEQSLFIFLPLTFATANNTLLEGMSLGVPVLCSDVGGVRDYVSDESYLARNVEDVVAFYRRQRDKSAVERQAEAETLVEHCRKNFGWHQIREKISALAEGLPPSGIRQAFIGPTVGEPASNGSRPGTATSSQGIRAAEHSPRPTASAHPPPA
jgi:glycosyltransferase involved in cell wall biosynthesis